MASSDSDQCARLSLIVSPRDNRTESRSDTILGRFARTGMLGGYYVNGMYISREDVMVLANGEQPETLNTEWSVEKWT